MAIQSSVFQAERKIGDCRPNVDVAVFYSGATNAVPTIEQGSIVFKGGTSNTPNGGIGAIGIGNDYRIPYLGIPAGGAGVKLRCNVVPTKPKYRFRFKPGFCGTTKQASLWLRPLSTCENPLEIEEVIPVWAIYQCSTMETPCQMTEKLAYEINRVYADFATATQGFDSVGYYVDVQSKFDGGQIYVESVEGLDGGSMLIPYTGIRNLTLETIQDWFPGQAIYTGTATVLTAIELNVKVDVPDGPNPNITTSDPEDDPQGTASVWQRVLLLFNPANTNSQAAYTAMITILNAGGNNYLDRILDETCADAIYYPYTVVSTDAGDASALATATTNYSAAKKISRVAYAGGKSTYQIYTNSATAPTANGSDVVATGEYVYAEPGTYTSLCAAGTDCADCLS